MLQTRSTMGSTVTVRLHYVIITVTIQLHYSHCMVTLRSQCFDPFIIIHLQSPSLSHTHLSLPAPLSLSLSSSLSLLSQFNSKGVIGMGNMFTLPKQVKALYVPLSILLSAISLYVPPTLSLYFNLSLSFSSLLISLSHCPSLPI